MTVGGMNQATGARCHLTGETVTSAVQRAAEGRLSRLRRARARGSLAAELMGIGRRCAALPDLDTCPAKDNIGYHEHGLPG